MMMECTQIDLYEFLAESELQHYYNAIKNELKITSAAQFKYATDEDLKSIGLSRPEIRRLRKFYEKHFPHGYLSKIKRLLQAPTTIVKRDDGSSTFAHSSAQSSESLSSAKTANSSPSKTPNNKHIIPADSISVNKQLGTGEFGIVQQGVWTNGTERIQVAIKCLCRERMQSNPMEFLKEAAIMHSIEHENIVRLYGVVLATDSLMLVTELAHLRSLLECLKDSGLRVSFLTIPTLCEFAMQICNGMRYLENKRLIHRDLAARNILVFSKNKVKISDFGLSRALGVGKDYYKTNFNVNLKLPIAWCAPECINYLRFTNASDVWAFGVCLWEMFSYGFQPWAALTGLQILEAIDAPNYQRLELPDCCPREYYTLMMKCWQDDPLKRPKFNEIYETLPDMKPEQLKAVVNCCEPKKDHLLYRQGEIITVLDRNTGTPFWKGVLHTGKTGYFNPSNTVAFLEGLPCSNRDSFCRISERSSKRKLRTEMISKPQNDFKHTGHVGIDGASFGDVAFLSNSQQNYNHVPHQIVTPYKPSEDIEQTPLLLPPTPTSPDSLQTASAYFPEGSHATSLNPSFVSSTENTPKNFANMSQSSFEFPKHSQSQNPLDVNASTNPFAHRSEAVDEHASVFAMQNNNYGLEGKMGFINAGSSMLPGVEGMGNSKQPWRPSSRNTATTEDLHEYHEISDDEITGDKLDFGPSLLDEINSMFGSMSATPSKPKSPDFENINMTNEFAEMASKLVHKNSVGDTNGNKFCASLSKSKKSAGTVKPISVKDEKILNHALEIANEFSARSMIDLVSEPPTNTQSPKRKFSFRFPHLSSNGSQDKSNGAASTSASGGANGASQFKSASPCSKKKNFTEELQSIPDLQAIIGEEGREAYNSLIERKGSIGGVSGLSPAATLLRHLDTNEFDMSTARTLPRRSLQMRNDAHAAALTHEPLPRDKEPQLTIPSQHAPRPMTLPSRGYTHKVRKAELSLAHAPTPQLLSSPAAAATGKENNDMHALLYDGAVDKTSPCESPSYMTHTFYKFPEKASPPQADANPIPLPPREGKKHIKTNPKRHVRKYPLIIPGNGVQRTLNKVTERTPTEEELQCSSAATTATAAAAHGDSTRGSSGANTITFQRVTYEMVPSMRPPAIGQQCGGKSSSTPEKPMRLRAAHAAPHIYQNVEPPPAQATPETSTDSASLQFESILEADFNKGHVLQSPDVTDGFYNFSIQKEHYNKSKEVDFEANKISGLYVNEDELRNLDIDSSLKAVATQSTATQSTASVSPTPEVTPEATVLDTEVAKTEPVAEEATAVKEKCRREAAADNELAGNALFKRVRESVDMAMCGPSAATQEAAEPATHVAAAKAKRAQTEAEYFAATAARLANSNSVSCEDLLEFADKKPKGCERGVDSDEVRIMMKVLGKDSTPTRCLHVLEFIDWDVHKAIKIIKLQNILVTAELNLSQSVEVLQKYEWDLHATALTFKGLKT